MNRSLQVGTAAALTVIGILALAGVVYLAFVFPATIATWAEQGRALSTTEILLVRLSTHCQRLGLLVIPVLAVGGIACGTWTIVAAQSTTAHTK